MLLTPGASGTAAAQEAPPAEVGCNTFDATGDPQDLGTSDAREEPRADLTQLCVNYGYALRVAVVVAQPTNPSTDPGWGEGGDSRLEVGIDTDDDPDFELTLAAEGEPFAAVSTGPDTPPVCVAPFYVLPTGYAVEISRNCLGVDTVAVSALMIYDPAPAPTTGPLVADLAPDAGFVPRVTRSAPAIPPPLSDAAAPVCMADEENDTVDEAFQPVAFDAADVLETCLQHGASEIRLTVRMRRPTDPQSEPLWRVGSGVGWEIDTNNDLEPDFNVSLIDTGVHAEPRGATEFSQTCAGTAGFDGTLLIASVPRACLGTPQFVAARPFASFARINQIEPQPPLAFDIARFPGFTALVGAPGVEVPTQATSPQGVTPTTPSAPAAPGTPAGVGVTVVSGVETNTGVTASSGTSSGATVTQTAARSSNLASTGAFLDPTGWALGFVGIGLGLVALSRRRIVVEAPGQWDLLPAPARRSFARAGVGPPAPEEAGLGCPAGAGT